MPDTKNSVSVREFSKDGEVIKVLYSEPQEIWYNFCEALEKKGLDPDKEASKWQRIL